MVFYKPIQIPTSLFPYGIPVDPPAVCGIEMAVIVVDKSQFIIRELAGKPELVFPGHVPFSSEQASERSILVASSSRSLAVENGSHVLSSIVHEIKILFRCHSPFPSGRHQDACSRTHRRIPQIGLHQQGVGMRQIQSGYLQIIPVQEPGVAGYCPIDDHFLLKAPSPVVVAAGDGCSAILDGEDDGAVVGVVGHFPDAR